MSKRDGIAEALTNIEALREIRSRVDSDPESLRQAPRTTVIGRPDETTAARNPILRYTEPEAE